MLAIARGAIESGLQNGKQPAIKTTDWPAWAQKQGAAFVTLEIAGRLRGCIGSLAAYRPLINDISENAFAAAFRDSRFGKLTEADYKKTDLSISILSDAEPLEFSDEADSLEKIRSGIDGLIFQSGGRRGTFLAHLKAKAGFARNYWSDDIKIWRYSTESFK